MHDLGRKGDDELARHGEEVGAVIESMSGTRFVHDTLELAGWDVELADARRGLLRDAPADAAGERAPPPRGGGEHPDLTRDAGQRRRATLRVVSAADHAWFDARVRITGASRGRGRAAGPGSKHRAGWR
jgi:hypothetical protein